MALEDLMQADFSYPQEVIEVIGFKPISLHRYGCLTHLEAAFVESSLQGKGSYSSILSESAEQIAAKGVYSYEDAATLLSYYGLGKSMLRICKSLLTRLGWTVTPPESVGDGILPEWDDFYRANRSEAESFFSSAKSLDSSGEREGDLVYATAMVRYRMARPDTLINDVAKIESERPGLVKALANFARSEEAGEQG